MMKTIKIHDFDDDEQLVRDMKISRSSQKPTC